ncbi:MAG TPA: hypothetical protein VNF04_04805 [Stellaceae bacterium]|nr:hypothetical protein [Stellaceae bacterium]
MPSVVDEMFFREGVIDHDFAGVNQCRAGDLSWERERGESEADFLARARMEARAAGYSLLCIAGHLPVTDVVKIH